MRDPTADTVLAESPLILRALPHETVNFSIGKDPYRGPDEFSRLQKTLAPMLGAHDADLSCLLVSDVLILAREAGLAISKVAYYVKARRWSATFGLPTALFYGLLRGGEPTRIDALLARPLERLWARLQEAKSRNFIGLALSLNLRGQLAQVQQGYLARPEHPYAKLLQTTGLGTDKQSPSPAGSPRAMLRAMSCGKPCKSKTVSVPARWAHCNRLSSCRPWSATTPA